MADHYTADKLLEIIRSVKVFQQFEDKVLQELISFSNLAQFTPEEVVIPQGVENHKIFIIIDGEVDIYADGGFISTLSRQGDLIGEMSVISKNPTAAEVRARTDLALFSISDFDIRGHGSVDLVLLLNKICLDILTYKLVKTTDRAKGFDEAQNELVITQAELVESQGDLEVSSGILNSVLESMGDGVVVSDAGGRIILFNQAFTKIIGIEQIPKQLSEWPQALGLFEKEGAEPLEQDSFLLTREAEPSETGVQDIYVKNGSHPGGIWIQANSNQLNVSGQEPGRVTVVRDITAKRMETEALIKAKEEAENAGKAKTNFLAVMSHELRTPLNSILGMAQLLQASKLDEDQGDCVSTLKSSGDSLFRMVSNILDLSQFEAGNQLGTHPETINLDEFKKYLESIHARAIKLKNIDFKIEFGDFQGATIQMDKEKIYKVLDNITDNAIKFNKDGGKVRIFLTQVDGNMQFKVTDQGIGIAEASIAGVFTPFSQEDNTYARGYDGLGIGLSLSKYLCEIMGGKIWLESELGAGTVVFASFPKEQLKVAKVEKKVEKKFKISPDFAKEHPLKILLAEDNLANQKLATKVLGKLGFEIEVANNGLEACEKMAEKDFDLILMDLQMPEMDGVAATKKILGEMKKDVKVIALTANAAGGVQEECMAAGMVGFLKKPMNIMELTKTLALWA